MRMKVLSVNAAGESRWFYSVQVMAMEAVSDKDSDGSREEDGERNEKSQEKKKKSSKVRISLSLCVLLRITAHRTRLKSRHFVSNI